MIEETPLEKSVRRIERAKELTNRPKVESIARIPCKNCGTMMPIEWLEHEVFNKILCIDGMIYCIKCAKLIAQGLQKELIGSSKEERVQYYKNIEDKITQNELLKKQYEKDVVDEIDADDIVKAKKLFRNKSGDDQTVAQMIKANAEKAIDKSEQKKIIIPGTSIN